MCRNIRTLHNFEPPATADEIHASALQYVRKISGSTKRSRANAEAFDRAVAEVAAAAEQRGWDGFFVWDHVVYRPPVSAVADPWITLAAVALTTDRLTIGP